jgi:Recombinase
MESYWGAYPRCPAALESQGKRYCHTVYDDPEGIALMHQLWAEGYSYERIAQRLNEAGASTATGGAWPAIVVWGIIRRTQPKKGKGKRGPKHPVAQKTRLSQHHPYVFGFRIVLLMVQWDVYRIPVDFALVRRTADSAYQPESALFRQMLPAFRRPAWC